LTAFLLGFCLPRSRGDLYFHFKAHPWFNGIDWENIRKYPAPFRPDLQHPEDTRHFDGDIPPEVSHLPLLSSSLLSSEVGSSTIMLSTPSHFFFFLLYDAVKLKPRGISIYFMTTT